MPMYRVRVGVEAQIEKLVTAGSTARAVFSFEVEADSAELAGMQAEGLVSIRRIQVDYLSGSPCPRCLGSGIERAAVDVSPLASARRVICECPVGEELLAASGPDRFTISIAQMEENLDITRVTMEEFQAGRHLRSGDQVEVVVQSPTNSTSSIGTYETVE